MMPFQYLLGGVFVRCLRSLGFAWGLSLAVSAEWDSRIFNPSFVPRFPNGMTALEVSNDGTLWVGALATDLQNQVPNGVLAWVRTDGFHAPTAPVTAQATGRVNAIARNGAEMYVGGSGLNFEGGPQNAGLARWDGTKWQSVGAPGEAPTAVIALLVQGGIVYVGEAPDTAPASAARQVRTWDGARWGTLGTLDALGINAFAWHHDSLHVGHLDRVEGNLAWSVSRWTGAGWEAVGTNRFLAESNPVRQSKTVLLSTRLGLVASGPFSNSSLGIQDLALWTGTRWQSVPGVLAGGNLARVVAIAPWKDGFLVSGHLAEFVGPLRSTLEYWDGQQWERWYDTGIDFATAAVPWNGKIVVACTPLTVNAGSSLALVAVDPLTRQGATIGQDFSVGAPRSLALSHRGLVSAGELYFPTSRSPTPGAVWDGNRWNPMAPTNPVASSGISSSTIPFPVAAQGSEVFFGLGFPRGGLNGAFLRLSDTNWTAVGAGGFSGLMGLHAGGLAFTAPSNNSQRLFHLFANTTRPFPTPPLPAWTALISHGPHLYAAGRVGANRSAIWRTDGQIAEAVASEVIGNIFGLTWSGDHLVVAGNFNAIDGQSVTNLAERVDQEWKDLGLRFLEPPLLGNPFSIHEDGQGQLTIAGEFVVAGSPPINNLARRVKGSWEAIATDRRYLTIQDSLWWRGRLHLVGIFDQNRLFAMWRDPMNPAWIEAVAEPRALRGEPFRVRIRVGSDAPETLTNLLVRWRLPAGWSWRNTGGFEFEKTLSKLEPGESTELMVELSSPLELGSHWFPSPQLILADGQVRQADGFNVTVTPPGLPPKVSLILPDPSSGLPGDETTGFDVGQTITLTATASDPENRAVRVEIISGTHVLQSSASPPVQVTLTNVASGKIPVQARAVDADGNETLTPVQFLQVLARPVNDQWEHRLLLAGANGRVAADNSGATRSAGDSVYRTLWWEWRPPATGLASVARITEGRTSLSVRQTNEAGLYIEVGVLNPYNRLHQEFEADRPLVFPVEAGVPVWFIHGMSDASGGGAVEFSYRMLTRPVNDDFAAAIPLPRGVLHPVEFYFAGAESTEPRWVPGFSDPAHTLWWHFTPPAAGRLTINGFNLSVVGAFQGGTLSTLTEISKQPVAVPWFSYGLYELAAGERIYVRLDQPALNDGFGFLEAEFAEPGFRFRTIPRQGLDLGGMIVSGYATKTHALYRSTNLQDWVWVANLVTDDLEQPFPFPLESAVNSQFWKIALAPADP